MMYDDENCGIGPHRLTLAQSAPNLIPPTSSSRLAYDVYNGKPRYFLLVYDDDRRSAAVIQYLCDITRWHQMTMRCVFYLSATWITKTDQLVDGLSDFWLHSLMQMIPLAWKYLRVFSNFLSKDTSEITPQIREKSSFLRLPSEILDDFLISFPKNLRMK